MRALTRPSWSTRFKFWRRLKFWAGAWITLFLFSCLTGWLGIIRWSVPPTHHAARNAPMDSSVFTRVTNSDTYLYSALVNLAPDGAPNFLEVTSTTESRDRVKDQENAQLSDQDMTSQTKSGYDYITQDLGQDLEVIITGLDRSRSWANSFVCCFAWDADTTNPAAQHSRIHSDDEDFLNNKRTHTAFASTYFEFVKPFSWDQWIKEYWLSYTPQTYVATQHSCTLPRKLYTQHHQGQKLFVSLAPVPSFVARFFAPFFLRSLPFSNYRSYCPSHSRSYLPVVFPKLAPNSLALCSKVNHNGGPDPEVLIEWFEVQRHLGVDQIVVYDMGHNSPELNAVFRHYKNIGILDLQPYDLPGEPTERSLLEEFKHTAQFTQDETMAVLECKVRVAGYGIVLSHDKDEILVPRQDVGLKSLLKSLFKQHPEAASLVFPTQFFLTTWPASHPGDELQTLRFRRTRIARWECWKYAFIPGRVRATITHEVFSKRGFKEVRIDQSEAILHHYRECPRDTWGTCDVTSTMDHTMTRYKTVLMSRVKAARELMRAQLIEGREEDEEDEDK